MYFLILLFSSFLILLPSLNLQIIIYLELEKYENQLLYLLLKGVFGVFGFFGGFSLVNSIVLFDSTLFPLTYRLLFLDPYQSSIILSLPQIELFIHQFVQYITYVFEIILLLIHTNTYLHGSHLTNALLIAYYLLFIPQYTLRIAPPIFLLL